MMNQKDIKNLYDLLDELMKSAPCKGGRCLGFQSCDFGENCEDGERCSIEDVIYGLQIMKEKM